MYLCSELDNFLIFNVYSIALSPTLYSISCRVEHSITITFSRELVIALNKIESLNHSLKNKEIHSNLKNKLLRIIKDKSFTLYTLKLKTYCFSLEFFSARQNTTLFTLGLLTKMYMLFSLATASLTG